VTFSKNRLFESFALYTKKHPFENHFSRGNLLFFY